MGRVEGLGLKVEGQIRSRGSFWNTRVPLLTAVHAVLHTATLPPFLR